MIIILLSIYYVERIVENKRYVSRKRIEKMCIRNKFNLQITVVLSGGSLKEKENNNTSSNNRTYIIYFTIVRTPFYV